MDEIDFCSCCIPVSISRLAFLIAFTDRLTQMSAVASDATVDNKLYEALCVWANLLLFAQEALAPRRSNTRAVVFKGGIGTSLVKMIESLSMFYRHVFRFTKKPPCSNLSTTPSTRLACSFDVVRDLSPLPEEGFPQVFR